MDPRIGVLIRRMEDGLETSSSIPELAAAAGLSTSRFAHLFRQETGLSPGRYLHRVRMQRARVLLETTLLSVREVMARVGFSDPSHFSRDFRRLHGIAPSAVRGISRPGSASNPSPDCVVAADRPPRNKIK